MCNEENNNSYHSSINKTNLFAKSMHRMNKAAKIMFERVIIMKVAGVITDKDV